MKAAVVHDFASPLQVEEVSDPVLQPGSVIVRVLAAFVPAVTIEFTQGRVPFALPARPYIPGADAIGVVERVADDVHGFNTGQLVYCDDYVTLNGAPAIGAYVGLAGMMPGAEAVLAEWPNGCFAEKFMLPAHCFTSLGTAAHIEPALLSRLGYIGTSYGAIQRGNFQPGQTAIVNGATGVLGVGTVLLLLAMGVGRVVALGRKPEVLAKLAQLDPKRVVPVAINDGGLNVNELQAAAEGPAQLVIDAIGFTDNPATTTACIGALGLNGFAVLMGGMNATIPIAYATQMIGLKLTIRGSEWFPPSATRDLLNMVGSGMLDLSSLGVKTFDLAQAQEALEYANSGPGGFEHVALLPTPA